MNPAAPGRAMPNLPGGRIQRAVPAPFSRPRISVGAALTQTRRQWRTVAAVDLKEGDIVPGLGLLYEVREHLAAPAHGSGLDPQTVAEQTIWTVSVVGGEGHRRDFHGGEQVFAFTPAP